MERNVCGASGAWQRDHLAWMGKAVRAEKFIGREGRRERALELGARGGAAGGENGQVLLPTAWPWRGRRAVVELKLDRKSEARL